MACHLSLIDPSHITVDGEIGRRFMLAIKKNLLQLDVDKFLRPFTERKVTTGPQGFGQYTGIGKLIDASVHFGLYCRDAAVTRKVLAFKDHLIGELLKTQMADGYIGCLSVSDRMKVSYDLHEQGYIVMGLANNAGYYLHAMPLFSALWHDADRTYNRVIIAVVNKELSNDVIRRINMVAEDIENSSGLLITVQDLVYSSGAVEF